MKKIKYMIFIILMIILFIPIRSYISKYYLYSKFQSGIRPMTDCVFVEKKTQTSFFPHEFDEVARLFYLCKIWGFVKYYHENLPVSTIGKMDSVLIKAIPKVINAQTKVEYCEILDSMLLSYPLSVGENPYLDMDSYALINNDWMRDTICLTNQVSVKIEKIFHNHTGMKKNNYVFNKSMAGNIRLMNEPQYSSFEFPDQAMQLLSLFRYWNVINYFYVYKNYIENWDEVLYKAILRFGTIDSAKKYRMEIYRLSNKLRDSHASYPATIDGNVFGPYRPNFRMLLINDTFIINKIRIPEYDKENFQQGDIVVRIDNENIHTLCDSLSEFVCGGTYWSNQSFLCNAVLSRHDSITLFTLLRGNDTIFVRTKNHKAYDLFQKEIKMKKKEEKGKLYKWVNDSIAYFNLCSATPGNFNKNYNPVKSASVIILDLRCYPNTDLILNLTDAFVPPNSFFAYGTYPDVRYPGLVRYCKTSSENIGDKDYYKGRIIVLVNEWTESYSEYVTMALQANPRTITVGSSSSGADGNVTLFEFPGDIKSVYTGVGIYYPDFTSTQCVGVRVDYIAEPTIESIKNNIDIAYEKAVIIAKQGNL